jgi:hypothetical protein
LSQGIEVARATFFGERETPWPGYVDDITVTEAKKMGDRFFFHRGD